ncbi:hypothetical protein HYPSUDRAFT_203415 [Hypholoma sublateritium FD-334 SS-4]|uniref:Uncharacterized protein n=1 Tax=Hypholoma sublateritium (strain FD-334 SS-4) TaxID=945553 RepID=A0A0D2PLL6_HYPSF|nr:hypothetical protein HYPSUDRAFT_203415 [Hypholoma sublateritium FD-334 SS-4]
MIAIRRSSQSVSSSSHTSGSSPRLDPNIFARLDTHFLEKAEEERLFQEIAAERAAAHIAGLALDDADAAADKPMLSIAEFRLAFGEDWQLSQFCYSDKSTNSLAAHLHAEEERLFQEIAAERAAAHIAGLALDDADAAADKPMLSIAEFRLAFGEDWQLSQFCYSDKSTNSLAAHLHVLCTPAMQTKVLLAGWGRTIGALVRII